MFSTYRNVSCLVLLDDVLIVLSELCVLQEMCRLAQIEYHEETKKAKELRRELMGQRREEKYHKHYNICQQVGFKFLENICFPDA